MPPTFQLVDKANDDAKVRLFRAIPPDWYDEYSGNVEAPTGWFGLVCVDDAIKKDWEKEVWEPTGEIDNGLYLVQINTQGTLWAWQTDQPKSVTLLESVFRDWSNQYDEWDNS